MQSVEHCTESEKQKIVVSVSVVYLHDHVADWELGSLPQPSITREDRIAYR